MIVIVWLRWGVWIAKRAKDACGCFREGCPICKPDPVATPDETQQPPPGFGEDDPFAAIDKDYRELAARCEGLERENAELRARMQKLEWMNREGITDQDIAETMPLKPEDAR
jgi:hypothetical protein